jgi:hypothetical protein
MSRGGLVVNEAMLAGVPPAVRAGRRPAPGAGQLAALDVRPLMRGRAPVRVARTAAGLEHAALAARADPAQPRWRAAVRSSSQFLRTERTRKPSMSLIVIM